MSSEADQAGEFEELFRAVYLTFHRRDGPRSQLPGASAAVLEHLALAGPLTIGEAAAHLRRAQSVVSEIVAHLERQGLLEREADPADRRRTMIWLTAAGHTALRRHREVLSEDLLAAALSQMDPAQAAALLGGLRALVQSAVPGRYCSHCTDDAGQLQSFEERFTRMTAWQARRNPGTSREEIERQTLGYMATMPAWRDHPRVTSRAG